LIFSPNLWDQKQLLDARIGFLLEISEALALKVDSKDKVIIPKNGSLSCELFCPAHVTHCI